MTTKLPLVISLVMSLSFIGFKSYNHINTTSNYTKILSRTGVAATFNLDRTGSPLSTGISCSQCHSGAFNNATTQYTPGDTYALEYNVSSNFGFARGFQSVILNNTNAQAGNLTSPGANTAIVPLNGRVYVEHSTPAFSANSYIFTTNWTAPNGMEDITIYASGIVGNGNNAPSGDEAINPISLTLSNNTLSNTSFELKSNIKLFPNPSKGFFNIDLGKVYDFTTLEITNINGQVIKTIKTTNRKNIPFNLEVSNGLYFARIITDIANETVLKLIVIN